MHNRRSSGDSTLSPRWRMAAGTDTSPVPAESSLASRHPVVRYMGFRSTERGREYTLSVSDVGSTRDFVLLITHQAFAARETRFQDAPDVCSAKLRRVLAADPQTEAAGGIEVTAQDLLDYRNSHLSSLEKRARNRG